jgi:hypothetical protein
MASPARASRRLSDLARAVNYAFKPPAQANAYRAEVRAPAGPAKDVAPWFVDAAVPARKACSQATPRTRTKAAPKMV